MLWAMTRATKQELSGFSFINLFGAVLSRGSLPVLMLLWSYEPLFCFDRSGRHAFDRHLGRCRNREMVDFYINVVLAEGTTYYNCLVVNNIDDAHLAARINETRRSTLCQLMSTAAQMYNNVLVDVIRKRDATIELEVSLLDDLDAYSASWFYHSHQIEYDPSQLARCIVRRSGGSSSGATFGNLFVPYLQEGMKIDFDVAYRECRDRDRVELCAAIKRYQRRHGLAVIEDGIGDWRFSEPR
jgi:hypothetical protein